MNTWDIRPLIYPSGLKPYRRRILILSLMGCLLLGVILCYKIQYVCYKLMCFISTHLIGGTYQVPTADNKQLYAASLVILSFGDSPNHFKTFLDNFIRFYKLTSCYIKFYSQLIKATLAYSCLGLVCKL